MKDSTKVTMTINRTLGALLGSFTMAALIAVGVSPAQAGQAHKAKITPAQAETAALKKYHTGKVHGKTELENEEGKWQYAVMVTVHGKMHEVMVGAYNGKIESEEIVTAKEEAAEKRAEMAAKKHPKSKKAVKHAKAEAGEANEAGEKGEAGEKK